MNRIEINVITGQSQVIALTPEEEADAAARTAAEATDPTRLQIIADTAASEETKADAAVQYLRDHTPTECADFAETLTNAQFRRVVAKVLCVIAKRMLR